MYSLKKSGNRKMSCSGNSMSSHFFFVSFKDLIHVVILDC